MNENKFWCAHCVTVLPDAEIRYEEKNSLSIYVKFDLTREALAEFSELKNVALNAGAVRTSILVWTKTPGILSETLGITLSSRMQYIAILIPTLDGNEIWILGQPFQEAIEKIAGFEKLSEPLLIFNAERLDRQSVQHPFLPKKLLMSVGDHCPMGTWGTLGTLGVGTSVVHGAPVELQSDGPIIAELQESGSLLVACQDIQQRDPYCGRCRSPVILRTTTNQSIRGR